MNTKDSNPFQRAVPNKPQPHDEPVQADIVHEPAAQPVDKPVEEDKPEDAQEFLPNGQPVRR